LKQSKKKKVKKEEKPESDGSLLVENLNEDKFQIKEVDESDLNIGRKKLKKSKATKHTSKRE